MAREWRTKCQISEEELGYSSTALEELRRRGQPRPQRAPEVEREYLRELRAMAVPTCDLSVNGETSDAEGSTGSLGFFPVFEPKHRLVDLESSVDNSKFGITEEKLLEMYKHFQDPKVQVLVAVAPTGSGKSTYLPYSLLVPPKGIQPDFFTRHGQIVITQPRIQATRNIPAFVGKVMHGCTLGAGFDVGFRHSGAPMSDWRSKLVYVTDGTLINWIAAGELDKISLIMIDEAHERSLNIDIIIGLLTKILPRYPQLRLIIASATIDKALFVNHFNDNLKGRSECRLVEFAGKSYGVTPHLRPEGKALEYDPENVRAFASQAHVPLAEEIVDLLKRMLPGGDLAAKKRGDILGFLQGERPIRNAVSLIKEKVAEIPNLRDIVDVLPLYTTLPQSQQDLALQEPTDDSRIRVVISTNVAETSLTIHGIKHVVETGLINQTDWDTETQTTRIGPIFHSQAGCRQRWGRAGRLQPGDAWCLYTEKQFNDEKIFPKYSKAEIERSPLEQVVLTAKLAGIDRLEPEHFPWIEPPPREELQRAIHSLRLKRALDEDGDLTAHGLELQKFGGDVAMAELMTTADRFACAIEMATVIPMLKIGGHKKLLCYQRSWSPTLQRHVRKIQGALIGGCRDDLEMCLKIYSAWNRAEECPATITGSWVWPEVWRKRLPPLPHSVRESLGEKDAKQLRQHLQNATSWRNIEDACRQYDRGQQLLGNWLNMNVRTAFARAGKEAWARLHFVDDAILEPVHRDRESQMTALSVRKKEQQRRPINFELLDRVRLVMAWCLKDNCFVQVKRGTGDSVYQALNACAEDKEADGDNTYVVEIGNDSVCYDRSLSGFLCGERRTMTRVPYAGAEPIRVLLASFIVLLNADWLRRVSDMSLMELARFVSEQTETQGQQGNEEGRHYRRLFIDQMYPLFGQVKFTGMRGKTKTIDVSKLNRLPMHPTGIEQHGQVANSTLDSDEPDLAEDDSETLENADKLSQRIQIDGVKLVESTESQDAAPDLDDDSDLEPADETLVNQAHAAFSVSGKLSLLGDPARAGSGVAEIRGFDWSGDEPVLLLQAPTNDESFHVFEQNNKVGGQVQVEVISHEGFPGDYREGLRVREVRTGLETIMEPENVSFSQSGHVTQAIPVGTKFKAVVEHVDSAARAVRLSTLPLADDLMQQIVDAAQSQIVKGNVCHVNQRNIFLHLEHSRPDRGIIFSAAIRTDPDQRAPTTYDKGYSLKVALRFKKTSKEKLSSPPAKQVRRALSQRDVRWDAESGDLLFDGRMPYAICRKLVTSISDPALCQSVERLFRNSNTPFVEVADPELAKKYRVGKEVQVKLDYVEEDWARGSLPDGANARLQRNGFPSGKKPSLGTTVTAVVLKCDVSRQEVTVSARRIFTTSLAVHASNKGRVIGTKGARLREIENSAGVEIEVDDKEPRVRIYGPNEPSIHQARRQIRQSVPRTCWGEMKIPTSQMKHLIGSGGSNVNRIRNTSNVDIDSDKKTGGITVHASNHRQLEGVLKAIKSKHGGSSPTYQWTTLEPVQRWKLRGLQPPQTKKVTDNRRTPQYNIFLQIILAFAGVFASFAANKHSIQKFAGDAWLNEDDWYGDKTQASNATALSKSQDFWSVIDDGILGFGTMLTGIGMAVGALFLAINAVLIFFGSHNINDLIGFAFENWKTVGGTIVGYAALTFASLGIGEHGLRQSIVGLATSAFGLGTLALGVFTAGHWLFGNQDYLVPGIIGVIASGFVAFLLTNLNDMLPSRYQYSRKTTSVTDFYPSSYTSSSSRRSRYSYHDDYDDGYDDYYADDSWREEDEDEDDEDEDEDEDEDDEDDRSSDEEDSYDDWRDDEDDGPDHSQAKLEVSCTLCSQTFSNKQGLNAHVKAKHSTYQCPNCSKAFPTKEGLNAHVGAKHPKYKCPDCKKAFHTKAALKTHRLAKHDSPSSADSNADGTKPHSCAACNRAFASKEALAQHKKSKHHK